MVMSLNDADRMAKSVNFDLGLHCLPRADCPKKEYYGNVRLLYQIQLKKYHGVKN